MAYCELVYVDRQVGLSGEYGHCSCVIGITNRGLAVIARYSRVNVETG